MARQRKASGKRKIIFFLAFIVIIFALDRLTKWLASFSGGCTGLICSRYSVNSGAAFSLFSNFTLIIPILIIIALTVLALTAFFYFKIPKFNLLHTGLTLLFTGTFCNLFDRLFFSHVIDFITFSFLPQFPAFNLADVVNVVGVLFLIIALIKK